MAHVWSFEHSKCYGLEAGKINIHTDNVSFKGLADLNNQRAIKLIEKTLHYNLEFEHASGKSNDGTDALSRKVETSRCSSRIKNLL